MPLLEWCNSLRFLSLTGLLLADHAYGAGFQLVETSVTGMGRATAGGSIAGDDLSAVHFNPADMMLLKGRKIQSGLSFVSVTSKIDAGGSSRIFPGPDGPVIAPTPGGTIDNGGTDVFVPNLYYVMDIDERTKFGLGLTTPFGLRTDYGSNWVGRYHALESELTTIDINPAIAYRLNEHFSVGAGVSAQYADVTLSQAVFTGGSDDGFAEVKADDWGFGFNLGLLYEVDANTRFGLSYRSKVRQTATGELATYIPGFGDLPKVGAETTVDLPETLGIEFYKRLDDRWALMAGARWTRWSRFDELRIKFADGRPDAVTEENWDNSWAFSVGVSYDYSPELTLRAGYMPDQNPIPSTEFRTPRIPGNTCNWLALGASYGPLPQLTVDVAYAHLFVDDAEIDNTIPIAVSAAGPVLDNLVGKIDSANTDLFGLQVVWKF